MSENIKSIIIIKMKVEYYATEIIKLLVLQTYS